MKLICLLFLMLIVASCNKDPEYYTLETPVDQMLLKKDIRDNKTNLTPEEQIKKILAEVGKLNRRRNVVYDEIMEELEEYQMFYI